MKLKKFYTHKFYFDQNCYKALKNQCPDWYDYHKKEDIISKIWFSEERDNVF